MINTIATNVQAAARLKNCNMKEYYLPPKKRSLSTYLQSWLPNSLSRRVDISPERTRSEAEWCTAFQYYQVEHYDPRWQFQEHAGATDSLSVSLDFTVPPEDRVFCEVMEATEAMFAIVQPEYALSDLAGEVDLELSCDFGEDNQYAHVWS
jgi:hypothetical protein